MADPKQQTLQEREGDFAPGLVDGKLNVVDEDSDVEDLEEEPTKD